MVKLFRNDIHIPLSFFRWVDTYSEKYGIIMDWSPCSSIDLVSARGRSARGGFLSTPAMGRTSQPDKVVATIQFPFNSSERNDVWERVYHGTSCEHAFAIAANGFNPGLTRRGKSYGPGIYATPSWNMATQWASDEIPVYHEQDGRMICTVLWCRVRPGSFTAHPLTWNNPLVSLDVDHGSCEYVVWHPADICVDAIIFAEIDQKTEVRCEGDTASRIT